MNTYIHIKKAKINSCELKIISDPYHLFQERTIKGKKNKTKSRSPVKDLNGIFDLLVEFILILGEFTYYDVFLSKLLPLKAFDWSTFKIIMYLTLP